MFFLCCVRYVKDPVSWTRYVYGAQTNWNRLFSSRYVDLCDCPFCSVKDPHKRLYTYFEVYFSYLGKLLESHAFKQHPRRIYINYKNWKHVKKCMLHSLVIVRVLLLVLLVWVILSDVPWMVLTFRTSIWTYRSSAGGRIHDFVYTWCVQHHVCLNIYVYIL